MEFNSAFTNEEVEVEKPLRKAKVEEVEDDWCNNKKKQGGKKKQKQASDEPQGRRQNREVDFKFEF